MPGAAQRGMTCSREVCQQIRIYELSPRGDGGWVEGWGRGLVMGLCGGQEQGYCLKSHTGGTPSTSSTTTPTLL